MEPVEQAIEIFLAEDNEADVELLQRCLRGAAFPYHLNVVSDGDAALAFLTRQAPYTEVPRSGLILLDIYLLKKSAWEILEQVRATPSLTTIPVVVLAGSLAPFDEKERDRLHPTHCLLKPTSVEEFRELTEIIQGVVSQNNSPV